MSRELIPISEIAENAKERGAIRLIDLVNVMAEDKRYANALPDLWHAYNLDRAADRMPKWKYTDVNLEMFDTRVGAWFWLLARFAGTSDEQGFYFKPLPRRKLLPLYEDQDGKFIEVQGRREIEHCVKLEDLKGFFEHIKRRHKIDVHLPRRLFGDAIGQTETEHPPPYNHSSDPQSRDNSAQAGIAPARLKSLAAKGLAFTHGPKHNRADNLARAMMKAWKLFMKDKNKTPTAFELWDWIPIDGSIQEKDPDSQTIYWKRADGSEQKTSFKSFQHRYTNLKRKLAAQQENPS